MWSARNARQQGSARGDLLETLRMSALRRLRVQDRARRRAKGGEALLRLRVAPLVLASLPRVLLDSSLCWLPHSPVQHQHLQVRRPLLFPPLRRPRLQRRGSRSHRRSGRGVGEAARAVRRQQNPRSGVTVRRVHARHLRSPPRQSRALDDHQTCEGVVWRSQRQDRVVWR